MVSTETGEGFAHNLGLPFLETSAKNGENVEAAFLAMASELIKAKGSKSNVSPSTQRKTPLTQQAPQQDQGCC